MVDAQRVEYAEFVKDWMYEDYPGQSISGPEDAVPTFKEWIKYEKEANDCLDCHEFNGGCGKVCMDIVPCTELEKDYDYCLSPN